MYFMIRLKNKYLKTLIFNSSNLELILGHPLKYAVVEAATWFTRIP